MLCRVFAPFRRSAQLEADASTRGIEAPGEAEAAPRLGDRLSLRRHANAITLR